MFFRQKEKNESLKININYENKTKKNKKIDIKGKMVITDKQINLIIYITFFIISLILCSLLQIPIDFEKAIEFVKVISGYFLT
jgi:hypothetical protein